jgi:Cu(I)/Ag(I) efflux system membrane protein CusA/SilA
MPPLDEGDLLYMPSALPGIGAGKAAELLQQTDRLIKTVPEVQTVFGKAGRAETATDPAPLEMFETTIQFKPREQWRAGMTPDKLVEELDRIVKVPGLSNVWVPPIRNRIDMLATGIKSPVGVKVAGADLQEIDRITGEIERRQGGAGRLVGAGRAPERRALCRRRHRPRSRGALRHEYRRCAGRHRQRGRRRQHRRNGRRPAALPDQCALPARIARLAEKLRALPHPDRTRGADQPGRRRRASASRRPAHAQERERAPVRLGVRGRPRARPALGGARDAAGGRAGGRLPPGYSVSWSGQFEYLERATAKLKVVVPATLLIIFVLLYMTFKRVDEALLIMATLPFALAGGAWLLWLLGTMCRSPAVSASSRWRGYRPNSASSCCCT